MKLIPYKAPTTPSPSPSPAPAPSTDTWIEPIFEYPPAPSPVIVASGGTLSTTQGTRLVNLGKVHTVARTTGVMPPAFQVAITAPLALLAGGNLTFRCAIQPTVSGSISVQLDSATPLTATGNGTAWTSGNAGMVVRTDNGWSWFEVDIPQRNDAGTTITVTMPTGVVQLPCLYYPPVPPTIAAPTLVGMKLNDPKSAQSLNYKPGDFVKPKITDLPAQPFNFQLASVIETGLRYEWRSGSYVAGAGGGRIEKTDGVWTPIKATANPAWIKSTGFDARYERTLKGEPITRVQFDVGQFTDRTKTLAVDVTDFVTGCSVSGYWGIMGRFFDQLVIDRTLRLFVGVDTATGRVILMVLDNAIAGSDKYCWIRNVRLNGYPADLVAVDDLARSAYPKN